MEEKKYLIGKKVKIEILKDQQRLFYTATILEYDNNLIVFLDRDGIVFSFNTNLVQQIQIIGGG